MIKRIKSTVPWTCVISDLNSEDTFETFYKKRIAKIKQKEIRIEKVLKKKR